jgi:peptidase E
MPTTIKPIFLLADSQLLFWRDEDRLFLERALALMAEDEPGKPYRAAYLGASNGDAPEFYDLFVAAMNEIGIGDCRLIPTRPSADDLAWFAEADLILLAGGDVERGWQAFKAAGLHEEIVKRYYAGALLVGVSAGAVQLGLKGWSQDGQKLFDTLRVVPFVIDAHDEPGWARLLSAVPRAGEHARGFGIPTGGGAIYHPDYSMEPVRHPVVEVNLTEEGVRQALLFPGEASASEAGGAAAVQGGESKPSEPEHSIAADGVIDIHPRAVNVEPAEESRDGTSSPPSDDSEPVN